ncbi:MAG: hypothetical protein H6Q77_625 [Gemmatimonadetes bacterium]|nr:hypothetical protein [Gemmatimonadota bacterium]
MNRRAGVTLVELLVGMVMSVFVGTMMISLLLTNSRFTDQVEAGREARGTARASLNLITTELRMVNAETGVLAADSSAITIRVPFMLGLACAATPGPSGTLIAGFLPVDVTMVDLSLGYTGFAIRQFDGSYAYSASTSTIPASSSSPAACTTASVALPSGSRFGTLIGPVAAAASAGTPVLLYRTVRYEFAPSVITPGRIALWRHRLTAAGAVDASEELAAPFDSTAGFRFFILNNRLASDTLPTSLGDLRGVEIHLLGESERTVRTHTEPEQTNLVTSVFFLNRLD